MNEQTEYPSKEYVEEVTGRTINDNEPYGFIYLVRNSKSNRCYVGQTKDGISTSKGLCRRYPTGWIQAHWSKLEVRNDLFNYGWSSFDDIKIIDIGYSPEELNILEAYYIGKYDSIRCGYNISKPNPVSYIYGKNVRLGRVVQLIDDNGNVIKRYPSISTAAKDLKISPSSVKDLLANRITYKGIKLR